MQFPVLHFGLAHSGSRPFNYVSIKYPVPFLCQQGLTGEPGVDGIDGEDGIPGQQGLPGKMVRVDHLAYCESKDKPNTSDSSWLNVFSHPAQFLDSHVLTCKSSWA